MLGGYDIGSSVSVASLVIVKDFLSWKVVGLAISCGVIGLRLGEMVEKYGCLKDMADITQNDMDL